VHRKVSVIIPTYQREQVLVDTIDLLLKVLSESIEIIVVDQTEQHSIEVHRKLESLDSKGKIRWVRISRPSIPGSMNIGVREANGNCLLFLDDDILPDSDLIASHLEAQELGRGNLIAGRVLQPWHSDEHNSDPFTKIDGELKSEFMGGNFSISRDVLVGLGGFDENFKGAAYNFEREFADRLLESGHSIWYEPTALIRHLHHSSGGTRSKGDHLTSWNPRHPVGAYYYLFVSPRVKWRAGKAFKRLFKSVITRHHLKSPWYIPVTLFSEITGMGWALWLRLKGPALPFANDKTAKSTT
jgi:GT2 family glycosyltransferase